MKLAELKIGQRKIHPPHYVDSVLKMIGNGRLIPLAVTPASRAHVEEMLHDSAYQGINNTDPVQKDKWFRVAAVVHSVLCVTLGRFETNQRRGCA